MFTTNTFVFILILVRVEPASTSPNFGNVKRSQIYYEDCTTCYMFFLLMVCGCTSTETKQQDKPKAKEAKELNNEVIPLVDYIANLDSCRKAISILDKATQADSNCFLCYYNKLKFLNTLKQYDKSIVTVENLIRIKPAKYDLYSIGAVLYENKADSIKSKIYFNKSLEICTKILDTMRINNPDLIQIAIGKAVNFIMLNDSLKGNQLLKQLVQKFPKDPNKEIIESLIGKSKNQLLLRKS